MEIIGIGSRVEDWWTAKKCTRLPDRVRTTGMGGETVRMTPVMRKALPANQPRARAASTAKRPVRCTKCQGFYGALKAGGVHAHKDERTGRDCPGGGASKNPRGKR